MNIAIVGCGRIAQRHADSITQIADAKLTWVCDLLNYKAKYFSQLYGTNYTCSYEELLEQKNIDVVNICTPSGLHAQMAIEAMKKGKHVIVEKPMALKISDAEKMIQTAKAYKRKMCIVLQNRYNPPMQDMKLAVEKGEIGNIYLACVTVRWYRPQEYYEDGWHGTKEFDGGALLNQAVHHVDALQWLLGMPKSLQCYKRTLAHKMEMEDTAVAILKFKNDALATIEASTICWPENLEGSIALFGEKGSIKVGGTALNRKIFWKVKGIEHLEEEMLKNEVSNPPTVYGFSHKHVIEDMIEAIKENRDPKTNGKEGINSLKLVLSLYSSAENNKKIEL